MAKMGNRSARMGQNEIGASMCRKRDGSFVLGPVTEGTPMSVNVMISCPPGTEYWGPWHTHPGGIPYPSSQDMKSGRNTGAKGLCITVPETGETLCHPVPRGRRR
jgi:proteasome lid subunit RPN8/RPN11